MSDWGGLGWAQGWAKVGIGGRLKNPIAPARGDRKRDYRFPIGIARRQAFENLARIAVPTFAVELVFCQPLIVRLE